MGEPIKKKYQQFPIRATLTNENTYEALRNIAERKDISVPTLIKADIHKIVDSYPEYMRKPLD